MLSWDDFNQEEVPAPVSKPKIEQLPTVNEAVQKVIQPAAEAKPAPANAESADGSNLDSSAEQSNANALQQAINDLQSLDVSAGLEELEGIANRTDFDLGSHSRKQSALNLTANVKKNSDSNAKLAVQDPETKEWLVPYVIEPSAGVERGFLAILNEAFRIEELEDGKE